MSNTMTRYFVYSDFVVSYLYTLLPVEGSHVYQSSQLIKSTMVLLYVCECMLHCEW